MDADDAIENPYPGLRPFQADETHLFFGRDEQTGELLRRLQRSRFLAIVGTSGSGKSSLVRAGMLPGLHGGLMAGSSQWRVVDMRPGTDPIRNLAKALDEPGALHAQALAPEDSFTDATLRRSGLGLVQAVREAQLQPGERVLVLVDQFEELFRAIEADHSARLGDDAAAFVKLLLEAAQQEALPIYVVLTMRSDFLGECAGFRGLPEAISDGQYLIPRLTRDQQREAISGPAAVHGAALTPTLVNRLLNDVGGNPDQLPILQHALMRTWDLWTPNPARGKLIDLPDYERIGGLGEALSIHADAVLDELAAGNPAHPRRTIAERLFKALATIGASGRAVRRFAKVQDVADIAGAPLAEVIAVVEAFRAPGNSFLMPPANEPLSADTTIDISHESLIRNWKKLRGWLAEEAESARIYERLATTAALRAEGQAGLWGQPDLGVALAWRERQGPTPAWARRYSGHFVQAMDFLDDSLAQAVARQRAAERRKRVVGAGVALSLLAMLALTMNWVSQDYERRLELDYSAQRTLEEVRTVNQLATQYAEHKAGGQPDAEFCNRVRPAQDTSKPVAVPEGVGRLCETDPPGAGLEEFFEIGRLLGNGEIDAADEQIAEAPAGVGNLGWQLLQSVVELQSSAIRQERRELVKLRHRVQARPAAKGDASANEMLERYEHPVHRAIAGKLMSQASQPLSAGEELLVENYRLIRSDRAKKREIADGKVISHAQPTEHVSDAASTEDDVPVTSYLGPYHKMAIQAAQHESAGVERVLDATRTYGWSLLVLLAWPAWRLWRLWQQRRQHTIKPRPSALRRSAAAVFDSGIALGLFWAIAFTSYSALWMVQWIQEGWDSGLSLAAGVLGALGYLLFADAIRFRHCRSLGKIAFDLRPVRDAGIDTGHLTLAVSARRNAAFAVFLMLTATAGVTEHLWDFGAALETYGDFAVFGLLALFWLLIGVMRGGTAGDRWSRTQVIDAHSVESQRIDAPPRYLAAPTRAATAQTAAPSAM